MTGCASTDTVLPGPRFVQAPRRNSSRPTPCRRASSRHCGRPAEPSARPVVRPARSLPGSGADETTRSRSGPSSSRGPLRTRPRPIRWRCSALPYRRALSTYFHDPTASADTRTTNARRSVRSRLGRASICQAEDDPGGRERDEAAVLRRCRQPGERADPDRRAHGLRLGIAGEPHQCLEEQRHRGRDDDVRVGTVGADEETGEAEDETCPDHAQRGIGFEPPHDAIAEERRHRSGGERQSRETPQPPVRAVIGIRREAAAHRVEGQAEGVVERRVVALPAVLCDWQAGPWRTSTPRPRGSSRTRSRRTSGNRRRGGSAETGRRRAAPRGWASGADAVCQTVQLLRGSCAR